MAKPLYTVDGGKLRLFLHAGQQLAWDSERRFIVVLAGTQGGKTSFGPLWLWREIQRCGPGDYMVVGPTLRLLERKSIPEFRNLFEKLLQLGTYLGNPRYEFEFSEEGSVVTFGEFDELRPTRVMFGYAMNPDSLESATAKAVWCDESGQEQFKEGSLDALLRRGSLIQARMLHTTTPYNFGWLKRRLYDPWKESDLVEQPTIVYRKGDEDFYYQPEIRAHPEIDVIRFESILNPAFPVVEYRRAKRDLPEWKFGLFYEARFTRPAGMIYDNFDEEVHVVDPFPIPKEWPRYLGLDFGGINTAAVFLARDPRSEVYHIYNTYHAGGRVAAAHVSALRRVDPFLGTAYGGAPSEDQWRSEFSAAGLPVGRPLFQGTDSVEVGIDRVYGSLADKQIVIHRSCDALIEEFFTYSRELDEEGNPTERIANKEQFHLLDALRYILGGWIRRSTAWADTPPISFPYGGQPTYDAANPFDPFGASL